MISASAYSQFSGVFEASGVYLSTHSAFSVLFEFFIGMYLFYAMGEKDKLIPIGLIGILGSIYGIDRFIVAGLFGTIIFCVAGNNVYCGERMNRILVKLDEYSFSIYLGHTTVMFIMSRLQEKIGFGNMKLAILDLIGCGIFIPILHELIEKPVGRFKKM